MSLQFLLPLNAHLLPILKRDILAGRGLLLLFRLIYPHQQPLLCRSVLEMH